MRFCSISRYVPSLIIGTLFCAIPNNSQSQVSAPTVVLEATSTEYESDGSHRTRLLVRLRDNGKLEWDNWVGWLGRVRKRQIGSVTIEEVSAIKQSLNAIDRSRLRDKMGPYYRYTDTSVELRVRLTNSHGELRFTVINPWTCASCLAREPLPKDVKAVVCAINGTRAKVAPDEPIDPICKASDPSH